MSIELCLRIVAILDALGPGVSFPGFTVEDGVLCRDDGSVVPIEDELCEFDERLLAGNLFCVLWARWSERDDQARIGMSEGAGYISIFPPNSNWTRYRAQRGYQIGTLIEAMEFDLNPDGWAVVEGAGQ